MLEFHQVNDSDTLEVTIDGAVTREDYDRMVALADEMIDRFGRIRMVEIIRDIGKIEPSALWEDLKWGPRHLKCFTRIAVVADQKWIEWMVAPIKLFVQAEIRCFHLDELDEARRWAMEDVEAPV